MKRDFKSLMPFIGDNDDPKYVMGFEMGQFWERLKNCETINNHPFHSENIDQMHLLCEHYKVRYQINPIDETWSTITVIP